MKLLRFGTTIVSIEDIVGLRLRNDKELRISYKTHDLQEIATMVIGCEEALKLFEGVVSHLEFYNKIAADFTPFYTSDTELQALSLR